MSVSSILTLPGLTDQQRADLAGPIVRRWAEQGLNHGERFADAGNDVQFSRPIAPNMTVNISTVDYVQPAPSYPVLGFAVGRSNPRGQ
jgi:hypothetical protein